MYYISTDVSLTSANIASALDSLDDRDLEVVLSGVSGDSREQRISKWISSFYSPTWENLGGECFCIEKEKALEEVKKHLKRNWVYY